MLAIVLLSLVAVAFGGTPTPLKASNCDVGNTAATFDPATVKVNPYPVKLPGSFDVAFTLNINKPVAVLTGSTIALTSVKRQILGVWAEVCPLVSDLCAPQDLCSTLPGICDFAGHTGTQTGTTTYTLAKLPPLLDGISEGTYKAVAKVVTADGTIELACLDLEFYAVHS